MHKNSMKRCKAIKDYNSKVKENSLLRKMRILPLSKIVNAKLCLGNM